MINPSTSLIRPVYFTLKEAGSVNIDSDILITRIQVGIPDENIKGDHFWVRTFGEEVISIRTPNKNDCGDLSMEYHPDHEVGKQLITQFLDYELKNPIHLRGRETLEWRTAYPIRAFGFEIREDKYYAGVKPRLHIFSPIIIHDSMSNLKLCSDKYYYDVLLNVNGRIEKEKHVGLVEKYSISMFLVKNLHWGFNVVNDIESLRATKDYYYIKDSDEDYSYSEVEYNLEFDVGQRHVIYRLRNMRDEYDEEEQITPSTYIVVETLEEEQNV